MRNGRQRTEALFLQGRDSGLMMDLAALPPREVFASEAGPVTAPVDPHTPLAAVINGTGGNDTATTFRFNYGDTVHGLGGNDVIRGWGILHGDDGDDTVITGLGYEAHGGSGHDYVRFSPGDLHYHVPASNSVILSGGDGNDAVVGVITREYNDYAGFSAANIQMSGGSGDDYLYISSVVNGGEISLNGGSGDDFIVFDLMNPHDSFDPDPAEGDNRTIILEGGDGHDTLVLDGSSSGVSQTVVGGDLIFSGFEYVVFVGRTLITTAALNAIESAVSIGLSEIDSGVGYGGDDYAGASFIDFGGPRPGVRRFIENPLQLDLVDAGTVDLLRFETARSSFEIRASEYGNTISGGYRGDIFWSGAGADFFNGRGGSDTVHFAGNRADYEITQSGRDWLVRHIASNVTDTLRNIEAAEFEDRYVSLAQTNILFTSSAEILDFENYRPDEYAEAYDAGNQFDALGGNDTVYLAATVQGQAARGMAGRAFDGGSGDDTVHGRAADDIIIGSGGADVLYGGGGNDVLTGGHRDGNDSAVDRLYGGIGSDAFVVYAGDEIKDLSIEDMGLVFRGADTSRLVVIGSGGDYAIRSYASGYAAYQTIQVTTTEGGRFAASNGSLVGLSGAVVTLTGSALATSPIDQVAFDPTATRQGMSDRLDQFHAHIDALLDFGQLSSVLSGGPLAALDETGPQGVGWTALVAVAAVGMGIALWSGVITLAELQITKDFDSLTKNNALDAPGSEPLSSAGLIDLFGVVEDFSATGRALMRQSLLPEALRDDLATIETISGMFVNGTGLEAASAGHQVLIGALDFQIGYIERAADTKMAQINAALEAALGLLGGGSAPPDAPLAARPQHILSEDGDFLFAIRGTTQYLGAGGDDILFGDGLEDARDGDFAELGQGVGQTFNGAGGDDTIAYIFDAAGVSINLASGVATGAAIGTDALVSIENAMGGNGADIIRGTGGANVLHGLGGDDSLSGYDGDDELNGGDGSDLLVGGTGANRLDGGEGIDTVSYAFVTGGVIVNLGAGSASASGVSDILQVIENVIGGAGADILIGDTGANRLAGASGNDILIGGADSDIIEGGDGYDIAVYSGARGGYATATSSGVTGGVEGGTDTISGVESLAFLDGQLSFHRDGMAAQVMRLYDSAFNRIPDASGFEAQLDAMEGGMSLNALAQLFVESIEFQNTYGALTERQFVEQLYRNVLDREGDEAGITNALTFLAGNSRGDLVVAFSESVEHMNLTQGTLDQGLWIADEQTLIIARLYDAAWNRLPDEGGLVTWRNALGAGMSLEDIADAFAGAAEFTNTYGTLTDRQFIEQLYRNVLNREADEGGIQNALNAIAGGSSRGDIMLAFSESAEHISVTRDLWIGGVSLYGSASASIEAKDAGEPLTLPGADDFVPLDAVNDDDALVLPGVDDALVWAKEADEALVLPGIDDSAVFVAPEHPGFDISPDDAFHGLRNEGWMH